MNKAFIGMLIRGDKMNILITGASSGIARKVVEKLLNKGHNIYITVHTNKQLELVNKRYQNIPEVNCFKLDVTNKKDQQKLEELELDVFISNAAIGFGGSLTEIPTNLVRDNFEVNVFSNLDCIQKVLKKMIKKKHGRIIIISSLAGIMPVPFLGSYCATKSSLNMISSTMRLEMKLLNNNIDIITIEPGLYETGFNQVMLDNKYDYMNIDTYFKEQIEWMKKYETPFFHLLETKNLDGIAQKIVKAITSKKPKAIYRTRPLQIVTAKLFQIFFT